MRAVGVFALLVTCVLGLGVMSVGIMTWDTFAERYAVHAEERKLAKEYIQQPHCRKNSVKRSKLKGFQHCDRSEKILAGSPFWFALLDVSHTIPPLVAQFANGARQDMFRIALTVAGMGLLWSWVRKYAGATAAQQWSQGMPGMQIPVYEDVITPLYNQGGLPMWQSRRRRRLSDH